LAKLPANNNNSSNNNGQNHTDDPFGDAADDDVARIAKEMEAKYVSVRERDGKCVCKIYL
jgi:hypothetical protein